VSFSPDTAPGGPHPESLVRNAGAALPPPRAFAESATRELLDDILPFWCRHAVDDAGWGFHGAVDAQGKPLPGAERGLVLNARIAWTFSAICRAHPSRSDSLLLARRACDALFGPFSDSEHGGFFWTVAPIGEPLDTRKQTYGQAFAIYGLCEFHALTGDARALELARRTFALVEQHCRDWTLGGYVESLARDWTPMARMQLSERDLEAPKSFNTNLHVLEAYTSLLRLWRHAPLHDALAELVRIHLDHIYDAATGRFRLFFDNEWRPLSDGISYGHDIEAAWLLHLAARTLGDNELLRRTRALVLSVADAVLACGFDAVHGGVFYNGDPGGPVDRDKHWWPQVEGAVGFLDAWELSSEPARTRYYQAAWRCWDFALTHLRDREHGEWRQRSTADGRPTGDGEKISLWKCPYHNARACLEIQRRLSAVSVG
jgi:mannobiose 2-epimerase